MAQTQYCQSQDVAKRISQEGLTLRVDDDAPSVDDCCLEASAMIDTYLGKLYPPAVVATIPVVPFMARAFALYFVCQRRNETPTQTIKDEFERYTKMLEQMAAGQLIPIGIPRPPGGLAVSNQSYDLEQYPSGGVERPRSTEVTRPTRRRFSNAAQQPYSP
jgi:phage gp36-like protein